jgi:hypothetical protein
MRKDLSIRPQRTPNLQFIHRLAVLLSCLTGAAHIIYLCPNVYSLIMREVLMSLKLKQIVVSIENAPGRLHEVTEALGSAGINLRALNLVDTGAFGQLRLLVSDVTTARKILMEMQIPAYVNEVVAAEIEDKPGSLAALLKPLTQAGVSVIFMYAFITFAPGNAIMIFRFSDNDKAIEVLKANGIHLLDAEAFGILENKT